MILNGLYLPDFLNKYHKGGRMKRVQLLLLMVLLIATLSYGQQWQSIGANGTQAIVIDGNIIYTAGMTGVYQTSMATLNWEQRVTGLPQNIELYGLAKSPTKLFTAGHVFGGAVGGVYESTNGGTNWSVAGTGQPLTNVLCMIRSDGGYIYVGCQPGAYRSTNDGLTWENISELASRTVYSLSLDGETIYAGTSNGIYRSTNHGETWGTRLGFPSFTGMAVQPLSEQITLAGSSYEGLKRSTNGGLWVTVPTVPSSAAVFSFIRVGADVYAGATSGVYKSIDDGATWTDYLGNFPFFSAISAFAVDESNNLYAGHGGGLSRTQISVGVNDPLISNLPAQFELLSNTPNPFNPTTKINFSLTSPSEIKLNLFDLSGREVAEIANGRWVAGTHSIQWDGSAFSSGTYILRLSNHQQISQRTISFVK